MLSVGTWEGERERTDDMSTEPMETPVIDYFYDEESRNWHFRAPALGVTGGGDATPEAAQRHAAEAIAFTLACPNSCMCYASSVSKSFCYSEL